ncbi:hypothetical protein [Streptomyces sp. NPDC059142]|uniref:hypothetical protein n=1 Tax=Streptomyces sp. NPDC059142 TaxID=3346739 RepID=UPI0036C8F421
MRTDPVGDADRGGRLAGTTTVDRVPHRHRDRPPVLDGEVPLDHRHPGKHTTEISISRLASKNPQKRRSRTQ